MSMKRENVKRFIKNIVTVQRAVGAFEIRLLLRKRWIDENTRSPVQYIFITDFDDENLNKKLKRIWFLNQRKKFEVYYGINLRKEAKKKGAGGKKDVIDNVLLFYADVDVLHDENINNKTLFEKHLANNTYLREEIQNSIRTWALKITEELKKEKIPPLAVIYSGWGVQFLFLAPRPINKRNYNFYEKGILAIVNDVLSRRGNEYVVPPTLRQYTKKDKYLIQADTIFDSARILRLPGYKNWRYSTPMESSIIVDYFDEKYLPTINIDRVEDAAKTVKEEEKEYEIAEVDDEGKILPGYGPYAWKAIVQMNPVTMDKVVDILSKYWVKGRRHNLSVVAAGYFRAWGYTPETVDELFRRIMRETDDDEVDNRIKSIETTYAKKPLEKVISYSIKNFLIRELDKEKHRRDVRERRVKEIEEDMKKLYRIVYRDIKNAEKEGRLTKVVVNNRIVNKL